MDDRYVLVVDDEEIIRQTLCEMIVLFGKDCECAENGESAIKIVGENPKKYQAVFLDLSMPGLDGTETLARLQDIVPDLPVYIVSGYGGDELEEQLASKGIAGILAKPFGIEELKQIIDGLD